MAQSPEFRLHLTDGDVHHTPSSEELQRGLTRTDAIWRQRALETLAKEIVQNVQGGRIEKGMAYTKVSAGYSIWYHQRANNRKDWYIFGHPGHKKFDSFAQWAIHLNHNQKLGQGLGTCPCKPCKRAPLTAAMIPRREWTPPEIVTPSDEEEEGEDGNEDDDEDGEDDDEDMNEDKNDDNDDENDDEDMNDDMSDKDDDHLDEYYDEDDDDNMDGDDNRDDDEDLDEDNDEGNDPSQTDGGDARGVSLILQAAEGNVL